MPAKMTVEQQIDKHSYREPNSGCWLWTGCCCNDGYGKARNSSFPGESLAHRLSWLHYRGPIQENMELDHKCRVRCCVNPEHLEPVLHTVNVRRGERLKENHRNARKTHCKRGHELAGENLRIEIYMGRLMRKCRTCKALTMAAWKKCKAVHNIEILES